MQHSASLAQATFPSLQHEPDTQASQHSDALELAALPHENPPSPRVHGVPEGRQYPPPPELPPELLEVVVPLLVPLEFPDDAPELPVPEPGGPGGPWGPCGPTGPAQPTNNANVIAARVTGRFRYSRGRRGAGGASASKLGPGSNPSHQGTLRCCCKAWGPGPVGVPVVGACCTE